MHAGHDPMHVAAALDRGARLAPILGRCLGCAGLHRDLLAIAVALPTIGAPVRSRDFRLSAIDARRLGRRGWRGWWSAVGSARDTWTRPLAIGVTTIGIAGLLLTAVPTFLPMAASDKAAPEGHRDTTFAITGGPSAPADPVEEPSMEAQTLSPVLPWLGLLAVGGGLFAARRVAAHGRPVR
jgi:hypothetical protein